MGLGSHGLGLLAAWALCFPIMTQVSSHQSQQLQVVLDNGTLNPNPKQILSFFFKLLCHVFGFSIEKNKAGVLPLEHQARQKTLNLLTLARNLHCVCPKASAEPQHKFTFSSCPISSLPNVYSFQASYAQKMDFSHYIYTSKQS